MTATWIDGIPIDITVENLEKVMLELWGNVDNLSPHTIHCRIEDQEQLQAELNKLCQFNQK